MIARPFAPFPALAALAVALAASLPSGAAQAQDAFPSRPATIVVPFPPGSTSDLIPRAIAPLVSQALGVGVVVENRPGAGGTVGAAAVARAKPDGHVILSAPTPVLAVNQWLYKDIAYKPDTDFAPITNAASTPNMVVVHPSVQAASLRELLELARRQPMPYASGGSGTTSHLCGELLRTQARVELTHVPYKGPGPALQDVLAGRVPMMCDNFSNVIPHVRSGRLRAIALTDRTRHAQAPDVPTSAEAGLAGFEAGIWYGMVAPAGTPRAAVNRWNLEIGRALRSPQLADRLRELGLAVIADSPDEFARFIAAEAAKWKRVVEVSGAKVD